MYKDRIDLSISTEAIVEITTHLSALESALHFLISLDPSEAHRLARMGQRNQGFVETAITGAWQNPTLLPVTFNLAALERDEHSRDALLPILHRVQRLTRRLDHTIVLLGADLFCASLAVYKSVQVFGRQNGLEDLYDQLRKRFARGPQEETEEPSNGNTETNTQP